MAMLGIWFAQEIPMPDGSPRSLADSVPFREVYIHALVRDANREKMSKTKGNVVDPIEIVKQYGTDAVRFTLASMASPGTDIAFNIARTEGYRAFANKIWNAARFLFQNVDRAAELGITVDPSALGHMPTVAPDAPLEARWIVAELHKTAIGVNQSLETYRYDVAAHLIERFFWGDFCSYYLEIVKLRLIFDDPTKRVETQAALTTLVCVFEASLRLLSPFMPFITEEIWHTVYLTVSDGNPPEKSIALSRYPQSDEGQIDRNALSAMIVLENLISETRALRKDLGVEENAFVPIEVCAGPGINVGFGSGYESGLRRNQAIVERLARASEVRFVQQISAGLLKRHTYAGDVAVIYEATIDIPAERDRLTKDIAKHEKQIANDEDKLNDPSFLAKAPEQIVEGKRKQLAETRLLLEKARAALAALPE
jgi:valyl-tRNA synthetase